MLEQTPLTRLVHMVENNHVVQLSHGRKRCSLMYATPHEIHMIQVAANELPDGSGRINAHHKLTRDQEQFCFYKAKGMTTLDAYLNAYSCSYATAKQRAPLILAKPNVYRYITNLRHGLTV